MAMKDHLAGERNKSPEQLQPENKLVEALLASGVNPVDPRMQGMARLVNALMGNAALAQSFSGRD